MGFTMSAISGLLIAMRCNSTFPAISDLVVMTMATLYSIPPLCFYILSLGIADFTGFFTFIANP